MLLATSCGAATADSSAPANGGVAAARASQIVIPSADRFSPFVTVVRNGTQITFHNGDTDAHTVVSLPNDVQVFNKLLRPGEYWTVTLTTPGTYRYFCSIHAQFDPVTGQVRALPHADHPDEPMEGVVVVD